MSSAYDLSLPQLRRDETIVIDGVQYLGVYGIGCDGCDASPTSRSNVCGRLSCTELFTKARRLKTSPNGGDI